MTDKHVFYVMEKVSMINEKLKEWPPFGDPMPKEVAAEVSDNVKYLENMMQREWFTQALSPDQLSAIMDLL